MGEAAVTEEGVRTTVVVVVSPFQKGGGGGVDDYLTRATVPRIEVPVGGRLQLFAHQWHRITQDPWVLEVVYQGYSLEFVGPAPLNNVKITPSKRSSDCPVRQEVCKLLEKNAVRPVTRSDPQDGFYSHFFL